MVIIETPILPNSFFLPFPKRNTVYFRQPYWNALTLERLSPVEVVFAKCDGHWKDEVRAVAYG
jgi:hypothetical protein